MANHDEIARLGRHSKRLKELRQRVRDRRGGEVIVDGRRLVSDLVRWGVPIRELYLVPESVGDPAAAGWLWLACLFFAMAPKLVAHADVLSHAELRRGFGGAARFLASAALDLLFALMLAPLIAFEALAGLLALISARISGGAGFRWSSPPREEAGLAWRAAAKAFLAPTAYGAALEFAGRPDEAQKIYRQVLAEDAHEPTMLAALERMARRDPPTPVIEDAVEGAAYAFQGLGATLSREENTGRRLSLIYAQLALHMRPDFTAAQLLAGGALFELEQYEAAAETFDSIDMRDPLFAEAQIGRSRALSAQDRVEEALETLQHLTLSDEAPAEVYFSMAEIQSSESRFGPASRTSGGHPSRNSLKFST